MRCSTIQHIFCAEEGSLENIIKTFEAHIKRVNKKQKQQHITSSFYVVKWRRETKKGLDKYVIDVCPFGLADDKKTFAYPRHTHQETGSDVKLINNRLAVTADADYMLGNLPDLEGRVTEWHMCLTDHIRLLTSADARYDIKEIIKLGKKCKLYFGEYYGGNTYHIGIFAPGEKTGEVEVDKATRKTLKKNVFKEYQIIADYIEYVFKTTKNESYPMEFRKSLDKI